MFRHLRYETGPDCNGNRDVFGGCNSKVLSMTEKCQLASRAFNSSTDPEEPQLSSFLSVHLLPHSFLLIRNERDYKFRQGCCLKPFLAFIYLSQVFYWNFVNFKTLTYIKGFQILKYTVAWMIFFFKILFSKYQYFLCLSISFINLNSEMSPKLKSI